MIRYTTVVDFAPTLSGLRRSPPGRYIHHEALATLDGVERISMIPAFRSHGPMIRDNISLNSILRIADSSELYYRFGDYRLEMLEARVHMN